MSELLAEVEEPVHPGDAASGEDGGTDGDEDSDSSLAGGGVVAVGRCDGPDDRRDDQHEDGDDQDERQERADHGAEVSDTAEPVEVGEDTHRRSPNRRKQVFEAFVIHAVQVCIGVQGASAGWGRWCGCCDGWCAGSREALLGLLHVRAVRFGVFLRVRVVRSRLVWSPATYHQS